MRLLCIVRKYNVFVVTRWMDDKKTFFPFNNHVKMILCVCRKNNHDEDSSRKWHEKKGFLSSDNTKERKFTHTQKKESKFIYLPQGFLSATDRHA